MTIIESTDLCKWLETAPLADLESFAYFLTTEDWDKASRLVGCVSIVGLQESADAKKVTVVTNQIMAILYP